MSARALGKKLGTSSQPIFGYFENMTEVRCAVVAASEKLYRSYLEKDMTEGKYPPYKASGMAYIRFAREEKELFKLLFMCDRTQEDREKVSEETEMLSKMIMRQVKVTKEQAITFYVEMWAYVHGIATMIATGFYDWNEEFCSQTLTDMYQGLKLKYENQSEASEQVPTEQFTEENRWRI